MHYYDSGRTVPKSKTSKGQANGRLNLGKFALDVASKLSDKIVLWTKPGEGCPVDRILRVLPWESKYDGSIPCDGPCRDETLQPDCWDLAHFADFVGGTALPQDRR